VKLEMAMGNNVTTGTSIFIYVRGRYCRVICIHLFISGGGIFFATENFRK